MDTDIIVNEEQIARFQAFLRAGEKSCGTVEHYSRAVRSLGRFLDGRPLSRGRLLEWKEHVSAERKLVSANLMIAGVNAFLRCCGCSGWRLRSHRFQRRLYLQEPLTVKDLKKLVAEAVRRGEARTQMLLAILAGTGIRVSELRFVTVEALETGSALVTLKGKTREVVLGADLRRLLREYARRTGISAGPLIVSEAGKPLDRRRVWEALKRLCEGAGVDPRRVFPHAFRHLFARVYYSLTRDLARLADQLGHRALDTTRIYVADTARRQLRLLGRVGKALGLRELVPKLE